MGYYKVSLYYLVGHSLSPKPQYQLGQLVLEANITRQCVIHLQNNIVNMSHWKTKKEWRREFSSHTKTIIYDAKSQNDLTKRKELAMTSKLFIYRKLCNLAKNKERLCHIEKTRDAPGMKLRFTHEFL
ncbi:hypothetical protein MRE55_04825 [Chlamydia psittaci]|nr:hypothetical protein MRE55_04825 [Chlamydia psittaci]